jgi:hypothetical protein
MTRRSRWIAIGLVVASVFAVSGCETTDYAPVATMQAMAESHLPPFPGATLLTQGSSPWTKSVETRVTGAYVFRQFGTDADDSAVTAYYDSQLRPLGWTGGPAVWWKGGWLFQIQEMNPLALTSSEQGYHLVFDEILRQDVSSTAAPSSANR